MKKTRYQLSDKEGMTLTVWEQGIEKPKALVFLHGIGGYGREALQLVQAFSEYHVVLFDQRGHGESTQLVEDLSREAFVLDVRQICEKLALSSIILVGQSMGAHTAMLVASQYPELVSRLILVEASLGGEGTGATEEKMKWFNEWPVPFATVEEAVDFFGGGSLGEAWAKGLKETRAGYVPQFQLGQLEKALSYVDNQQRLAEWQRIVCPILLIKGANGSQTDAELAQMLATQPHAEYVELEDVGTDAALEDPEMVGLLIKEFLNE